jgi:transcriptional regulator
MYVPTQFRIEHLPDVHAAMRLARLANLVTVAPDGLVATPLPVMLSADEGEYGTLYAHVSKANPQWRTGAGQEALVMFMGPDAYVSPSWYATKQIDGKVVPTWNYIAVHAYGPVEFFHETDRLLDVVTRLTNQHEQPRAHPWAVSDAPPAYIQAHMKGIVGVRIPITRLEGKQKMSQNRTAADRAGVKAGLAASDVLGDRVVAGVIEV